MERQEEIKQTITKTNETVIHVREELSNKINHVEEEGKIRIQELQKIATEECIKNKHEVLQKLKERHKEIQTDISERVEGVYTTINKINRQTQENKEKIVEINSRRGKKHRIMKKMKKTREI